MVGVGLLFQVNFLLYARGTHASPVLRSPHTRMPRKTHAGRYTYTANHLHMCRSVPRSSGLRTLALFCSVYFILARGISRVSLHPPLDKFWVQNPFLYIKKKSPHYKLSKSDHRCGTAPKHRGNKERTFTYLSFAQKTQNHRFFINEMRPV